MFVLHFSQTIQLTSYVAAFFNPWKIKSKNNKKCAAFQDWMWNIKHAKRTGSCWKQQETLHFPNTHTWLGHTSCCHGYRKLVKDFFFTSKEVWTKHICEHADLNSADDTRSLEEKGKIGRKYVCLHDIHV